MKKDTMNLNSESNYINKIREIALKVVTNITVEPVIFFYAIGFGITTIISPSLYFDKICTCIYLSISSQLRKNRAYDIFDSKSEVTEPCVR